MADENDTGNDETETAETGGPNRRAFLRTAAAGAAGVAAVVTLGAEMGTASAEAPKEPAKAKLTAAEQAKEDKRVKAEALLKEINADVEVQWVKAKTPNIRKVIQLEG